MFLHGGGQNAHTEVEELRGRVPDVGVVTVAGAGHGVQSDQPRELAQILADFLTA